MRQKEWVVKKNRQPVASDIPNYKLSSQLCVCEKTEPKSE